MIDFAVSNDLPVLRDIWVTCFGDDDAYVGFIFRYLLRPEHILIHTEAGGRPTAMLCIEPFTLITPLGQARGAYIFGVATLPEHRGQGLSTILLDECHHRLSADGYALSALVPASDSLFDFYGKRGYETSFHVAKASLAPEEITPSAHPCALSVASLENLRELRDNLYSNRAQYVRWSSEYLAYIGRECGMLGGDVLRIDCGGVEGYAVCYPVKERVIIKELAMPDRLLPDALAALHARYGADRYHIYLPADTRKIANKVLPFAMVRWYDKDKQHLLETTKGPSGWIAHVLD